MVDLPEEQTRLRSFIMSFTEDMPLTVAPVQYRAMQSAGLLNDPDLARRVVETPPANASA